MIKAGIDYTAISTPFYCHDGHGNILLHKRSQQCRDERGTWDCGSGRLKFGENPEDGVLRELNEEYGCTGKIQLSLPYYSIQRIHDNKKTHWIALPFIILVNPKKVQNKEPHKILELSWFRLTKLPKPLHQGFLFGLKKYKKQISEYI